MKYPDIKERFIPWQPSTWPEYQKDYTAEFSKTLEKIIRECVVEEINNTVSDINANSGCGLVGRGHVILIALMCAIDSLSAYAFYDIKGKGCKKKKYAKFIETYFPPEYQKYGGDIYDFYRTSSVHSWNIFKVSVHPGDEPFSDTNGSLSFGLLTFNQAFTESTNNFFKDLSKNTSLQKSCLERYNELKITAVS